MAPSASQVKETVVKLSFNITSVRFGFLTITGKFPIKVKTLTMSSLMMSNYILVTWNVTMLETAESP